MIINIDNKIFDISPFGCNNQDKIPFYINISNKCNASCTFCCNKNIDMKDIDFIKLKEIIGQCHNYISRFSISGGEPLADLKTLVKLLTILNEYNIHITLNTNGINLLNSIELLDKHNVSVVQLSRHHYNDEINNEIFGTYTISYNEIMNINAKFDLRLNCILMKKAISNREDVINYLEHVSKVNISEVGFVGLMRVNKFAKDNYINYRDITKEIVNDDFLLTKERNDGDRCSCVNYVYVADNGKPISTYFREVSDYTKGGNCLFFDSNGIKDNF